MSQEHSAKEAFENRKKNIAVLMAGIERKLTNYAEDEPIHWGHAGSLGHVEELLEEIDQFLG